MFSGIVEETAKVVRLEKEQENLHITMECSFVDELKIDQAFIAQLADPDANTKVIEAIVAMGKAMELVVVAEGVETDQQYAIVRRLGCDLAQGYFIARPMPADQLLAWCGGYEDTQSLKHGSTVIDIDKALQ